VSSSGDDDAHLSERRLSGGTVFQGNFLRVDRDVVALPDGRTATREYIRHPGAVCVLPLMDDGRLLMIRQHRHPLGRVLLEIPAGKLDAGESVQRCGQRELLEESGFTAREWARAGLTHNACAYSDEFIEIWFARGLTAGAQQLDEGEFVQVFPMTEAEVDAAAGRGELTDAKTLIALLWLQRWRAGAWPLNWVAALP
jgi:ADP-ribose pyrophosphatase